MDNLEKAKQIISKIPYITLATVDEYGKPWNTPVFTAHDVAYNFYWGSHEGAQHSKNISSKPGVFLVIYNSTIAPGQGEGVYIEAVATELSDSKEIKFVHQLLSGRHLVPYWRLEQVQGSGPIRLYKATPKRAWVNGEGEIDGHYIDTRVEIKLS